MKINTSRFAQMLPCRFVALVILGVLGPLSVAQAVIALTFIYDGVDTVVEWSGTWDVGSTWSGSSDFASSSSTTFWLMPGYSSGPNGSGIDGPYPWSSSYSEWAISEGAIGFDSSNVYGPMGGFTPGTEFSGSAIAAGTSLSDLGFSGVSDFGQSASGILSGDGGTVNWIASYGPIPEPETYAMLVSILALATVLCRRTERKNTT
jgi:hypothetical protein